MEDVKKESEVQTLSATVIKAEAESMSELAWVKPRNQAKALKEILDEVSADAATAEEMFYSIPFKKRDKTTGQIAIVHVEGLSIEAAMVAGRHWGNCVVGARIEAETDAWVDIIGVFHDYESNFRVIRPQRVSKFIKYDTGKTELLAVDRLGMAIQSGASKALRNAVIAGIPTTFRRAIFERVKQMATPQESAVKGKIAKPSVFPTAALVAEFRALGVERAVLEASLGHSVESLTADEIARLRGLRNALKDGLISVEAAFAPAGETVEVTAELNKALEDLEAEAATVSEAPEPRPIPSAAAPPASVKPESINPEEKSVADLLASLDEVKAEADHDSWPGNHAKVILRLSTNARETILSVWKERGRKFRR